MYFNTSLMGNDRVNADEYQAVAASLLCCLSLLFVEH